MTRKRIETRCHVACFSLGVGYHAMRVCDVRSNTALSSLFLCVCAAWLKCVSFNDVDEVCLLTS